ncbi:MAG: septal ring lytic transglycosylase RlpA family protein [Fimbriimonadaceae bacterium]|nr:septal ring lytic transglycosylase RlpA family protein [Fimbriimonadaceae bacterium]
MLRDVAGGPLVVLPPDSLPSDLLDDLRALPTRLQAVATERRTEFGGRRVLLVRQLGSAAEAALVDLALPRLLGYRHWPAGAAGGDWPAAVREFVGETLGSTRGEVWRKPAPAAATLPSEAAAAAPVSPVRDQPAATTARDSFAGYRPPPAPAPMPVSGTAPPAASAVASRATAQLDADAFLRAYAGHWLTAGGLGQPAARPQVLEGSFALLLVPTHTTDPAAPPVRMTVTVYAVGSQARVESMFSRAVPLRVVGRNGTWVSADIDGYRVEEESLVEVERAGLLSIQVRPLETGGTRVGFRLTGAGEVDLERTKDGRILLATIYQSEERQRQNELASVAGELPWDGNFAAGRSWQGIASWYGGSLHGGPTASGERYNQWGWTCAHRSLPLGSYVRVTNLKNGRQVVLRVNDRGPYIGGRIVDVSAAAAQALGFYGAGLTSVQVEALSPNR